MRNCKGPEDDESCDLSKLPVEVENNLSPTREFLTASHAKITSGDEKFHFILQIPKQSGSKEYIPQAGVIDFDKKKLVMCAFFPDDKYSIYACEFSDCKAIPWDSINASLREKDDNMDQDKKDDQLPLIEITAATPDKPRSSFNRAESDLIRLDILLKNNSWIHFILNGQEIGNSSFTNQLGERYLSGHINLFPIVRGIQNFKVSIG